jgi:tRNA U55 pseudouridine synthase TruB
MRSLAEEIGRRLNTTGLAYAIHRHKIGIYNKKLGAWEKEF